MYLVTKGNLRFHNSIYGYILTIPASHEYIDYILEYIQIIRLWLLTLSFSYNFLKTLKYLCLI